MKPIVLFVCIFLSYLFFQDLSSLFLTGRKVGFLPFGQFVDLFSENGYWWNYLAEKNLLMTGVDTVYVARYSLNESFSLLLIFYWQIILAMLGYRLYAVHLNKKIETLGLSEEKIEGSLKTGLKVSLWLGVTLFAVLLVAAMFFDTRIDQLFFYTDSISYEALKNPLYFFSLLCAGCLGASIFEEFLFRGVLYAGLKEYFSVTVSILVGAILFALLHFDFTQMPMFFFCGLVAGFLRYKTDHILAGIVFHFCANFFISCLLPFLQH